MKYLVLLFVTAGLSSSVVAQEHSQPNVMVARYDVKTPGQRPQPGVKFKARPSTQSWVGFNGCCAKVHNACVSICNKPGGCTGVGDCIVNPN